MIYSVASATKLLPENKRDRTGSLPSQQVKPDRKYILLDGHNRYDICTKHSIPYEIEDIELASRDDAVDWMINHQLSRRNITAEQQSYLRGLQYEREKKKVSNASGKNQHTEVGRHSVVQPKTREKLAEQHRD